MKVNGYGIIKPALTGRKASASSASGVFADFLSEASAESANASAVSELASTSNLTSLLALQEVSEEERKRERLVKQGKNMLDVLERLRQQLLIGEIPASMLPEIASSLQTQKETVLDPHLIGLIEDIELRVAVELAKLEMAFASHSQI